MHNLHRQENVGSWLLFSLCLFSFSSRRAGTAESWDKSPTLPWCGEHEMKDEEELKVQPPGLSWVFPAVIKTKYVSSISCLEKEEHESCGVKCSVNLEAITASATEIPGHTHSSGNKMLTAKEYYKNSSLDATDVSMVLHMLKTPWLMTYFLFGLTHELLLLVAMKVGSTSMLCAARTFHERRGKSQYYFWIHRFDPFTFAVGELCHLDIY